VTTIAEALGITWNSVSPEVPEYRLTYHAQQQAAAKGWSTAQILEAANNPLHTYPSGRVPGQVRHVRGDIVAVIDPAERRVVTVYADVRETALRADQTDLDARMYDRLRVTRLGRPAVQADGIAY
jgi:hypothetical protein